MRLPDGVTGTVTYDETEVIRRDHKQIRRTGDPRQKAETQIVRAIEQWRTEDATNISINVKKLNSSNMVLEAKSHVENCKNHFEAQRLRIFEYIT